MFYSNLLVTGIFLNLWYKNLLLHMWLNSNEFICRAEIDLDSLELDFQGLMLYQRLFWYLSLSCREEERGLMEIWVQGKKLVVPGRKHIALVSCPDLWLFHSFFLLWNRFPVSFHLWTYQLFFLKNVDIKNVDKQVEKIRSIESYIWQTNQKQHWYPLNTIG